MPARWYRSLYWRIAFGFVLCLVAVLVAQALLLVFVASRSGPTLPGVPPERFARAVAQDLAQALERNPSLDLGAYIHEQYGREGHPLLVVLADGREFSNGYGAAPAAMVEATRERLKRGGFDRGFERGFDRGGDRRFYGPSQGFDRARPLPPPDGRPAQPDGRSAPPDSRRAPSPDSAAPSESPGFAPRAPGGPQDGPPGFARGGMPPSGGRPFRPVPFFVNDMIMRVLAGMSKVERPLFLKMPFNGRKAMEELASHDPGLVIGILGGYIRWSRMVDDAGTAITLTERIAKRQLDPFARQLILSAHEYR